MFAHPALFFGVGVNRMGFPQSQFPGGVPLPPPPPGGGKLSGSQVSATGNGQVAGIVGGGAHAIAVAAGEKVVKPRSPRNAGRIVVVYWVLTAFTRLPSSDSVNTRVLGSQIPRTMFPLGLFPVLRSRLMVPPILGCP